MIVIWLHLTAGWASDDFDKAGLNVYSFAALYRCSCTFHALIALIALYTAPLWNTQFRQQIWGAAGSVLNRSHAFNFCNPWCLNTLMLLGMNRRFYCGCVISLMTFYQHNLEVLVLSSEGNFDPQRLALESGSLLLGPMEEAFSCNGMNRSSDGYSPRFAGGGPPTPQAFLANSNIYTKIRQKHCFFQCFYHVFRRKHRNLRGFRFKVGPKHWFLQFSMLWHPKTIQNIAIYSVFSFLSVFPLLEADKNDPKFRFNTLLSSDTQKSSKKHANTTNTRSRCEIVFGPPPAKADIATAILTNVIKHLV